MLPLLKARHPPLSYQEFYVALIACTAFVTWQYLAHSAKARKGTHNRSSVTKVHPKGCKWAYSNRECSISFEVVFRSIRSYLHFIIQTVWEAINRSINQPTNQSINQVTERTLSHPRLSEEGLTAIFNLLYKHSKRLSVNQSIIFRVIRSTWCFPRSSWEGFKAICNLLYKQSLEGLNQSINQIRYVLTISSEKVRPSSIVVSLR